MFARTVIVIVILTLAWHSYQVFLASNLHVVVPGRVYRSAQLSPKELERVVRKYAIRTLINLRGNCYPNEWYIDECRVTHSLNVGQEDISFSAGHLPAADEVERLIGVLNRAETPMLLHCQRGADRTGLASAIAVLLQPDGRLHEARRQLSIRYGHVPIGRPLYLDHVLQLYSQWLKECDCGEGPQVFRQWLKDDYRRQVCGCSLEWLQKPAEIPSNQPTLFSIRVRNESKRTWRFSSGSNAGFHLGYNILDADGMLVHTARAGLFDADVVPGQSIDVTVPLPSLRTPGTYLLQADLIEEQHCWFHQLGVEPLESTLVVR